MKTLLLIGIGAGDPDYITVQAVKAMNRADAFFLLEKGEEKASLIGLRREIVRRHVTNSTHRFVDATSPAWDKKAPDYLGTVDRLNRDKRAVFERLIGEELQEGECGVFLIWGDPSLYDSTIRILDEILAAGTLRFDYEVIPGITAVQALTARHKTLLNSIAQPVAITTGRRLAAEGFPPGIDSVVVMLDGDNTYRRFADQEIDIWWGAYLGTPDEILIAGKLKDVAGEIERMRAEARAKHGWIMDTYLMRRRAGQVE
jgi:precorrin-6A synthase